MQAHDAFAIQSCVTRVDQPSHTGSTNVDSDQKERIAI